MATPVVKAQDKTISVPTGMRVATGYVDIFKVRLACRERMAVGDVGAAYQSQLQLGSSQAFPCPTGFWEGETFVIEDGRHTWVAAVMLGLQCVLVAWLEG
jgi:hypothetical protein